MEEAEGRCLENGTLHPGQISGWLWIVFSWVATKLAAPFSLIVGAIGLFRGGDREEEKGGPAISHCPGPALDLLGTKTESNKKWSTVVRDLADANSQCCPVCCDTVHIEVAERLAYWFQKCEEMARSVPRCPQCQSLVHTKDVIRILGRQLRPAPEDDLDGFMVYWLIRQ